MKITKREANEIKLNHAIVEVDILIYLLTKKREKKNSKTTEDWSIKQKHILTFWRLQRMPMQYSFDKTKTIFSLLP